jgi:hypothetical protein
MKKRKISSSSTSSSSTAPVEGSNRNFVVKPHPQGIKPMGNMFAEQVSFNRRDTGLGNLQMLEDQAIQAIIG